MSNQQNSNTPKPVVRVSPVQAPKLQGTSWETTDSAPVVDFKAAAAKMAAKLKMERLLKGK